MPSNQWHISDQPVFAQRLHNSSSDIQKENKSIDSNTAQQTCFGHPIYWNKVNLLRRNMPLRLSAPTIGGILVGRNDYGWVRRKKNPRFRVLQPVKWKQTHPSSWWHHLVGGSAKLFWSKLTGNQDWKMSKECKGPDLEINCCCLLSLLYILAAVGRYLFWQVLCWSHLLTPASHLGRLLKDPLIPPLLHMVVVV